MGKILLTGAAGFIGTHVRRALWEAGYETVSLVRTARPKFVSYPSEQIVIGTLAEPEILEQSLKGQSIDACVHLAWEGIPNYGSELSMKNLEYGFNVLHLCNAIGIKKLVISGSCWEYLSPSGPVPENAALSYENPFKAAKNTLHAMSEAFCSENGLACHWLRLFYVYGAGQRSGALIPYIVAELKAGIQPVLKGAFNRNDFVHVSDVAQAVCKSLEHMRTDKTCKTFNIGSGEASQVLDIAAAAAQLLHTPFDTTKYVQLDVAPVSFQADIRAAKNVLGWTPRKSLPDGIKEYIQSENEDKR